MNKTTIFLVSLLAVLIGCYIYFFTDVFYTPVIQIVPQSRPNRTSALNPDVYVTSFMLDGEYNLTSVKVYVADEIKTNKFAEPIWDMTGSGTNKHPTKVVHYGVPPPGMKPTVAKARPKGLQPDVTYRIMIEAGKSKGTADFQARAADHPASN